MGSWNRRKHARFSQPWNKSNGGSNTNTGRGDWGERKREKDDVPVVEPDASIIANEKNSRDDWNKRDYTNRQRGGSDS